MIVNLKSVTGLGTPAGGYVSALPGPKTAVRTLSLVYGSPLPDPIARTTAFQAGTALGPQNFYLVVVPQQ
jgi:hypothetical protein